MRRIVPAFLFAAACSTATDRPPEITAQRLVVAEDTATAFDVVATDPDGDEVTITIDDPANGTVIASGGRYNYVPDTDFDGSDLVVAHVTSRSRETVAYIEVAVIGRNDAPTAAPDHVATQEDVAVEIAMATLLRNDRDPERGLLSMVGVGGAVGGTVVMTDGAMVFAPAVNYTGKAGFTYLVSDGELTAAARVQISVGGVNDVPVAEADHVDAVEDQALAVDGTTLVANDRDADGQTLWVLDTGRAIGGTVALVDTQVIFTPTPNHHGVAGFEYLATDGLAVDVGWATVDIAPVVECGDGEVNPAVGAQSITLTWLATACDGPNQIAFSIGGVEVVRTAASGVGCTCNPQVRQVTLSEPSVLELLAGSVDLEISAPGRTLLAWATVEIADPTATKQVLTLFDAGGSDPSVSTTNLCLAGSSEDVTASLRTHLGEQCDDGNAVGNDGCSATCTPE